MAPIAASSTNIRNMQKIELINTLPAVFAGADVHSEVWHCHVTLERGRRYLVTAESGTGKSSMCSYIYGHRRDYSGTIAFDGADVRGLTIEQWCEVRRRHIAYLPQEMRLFAELTVLENIALKNSLTGHKTRPEVEQMLDMLGIADKTNSLVGKLSIGQQQRVAVVRTLCQPCDFFLLDEPVSHLDEHNNRMVAQLVMEEAQRQGAGIIATSVGNHLAMDVDHILKL